jgi:ankyrin repeat protein
MRHYMNMPTLCLTFCYSNACSCIIYFSHADNERRDIMQSIDENKSSTTSAANITTSASATSSAAMDTVENVSEEMILACCKDGDITKLRLWNSLGVNLLYSESPLIRAVGHGQVDVVRYLVEEVGADVNRATVRGLTPLIMAAVTGNVIMLRYLGKELGANVNSALDIGTTALIMAAESHHVGIVRCLVKEFGVDVNQANPNGNTALHQAALLNDVVVLQCLVKELGADVNRTEGGGMKPMDIAALQGHLGVVHWLLAEGGANVDEHDSEGNTLWQNLMATRYDGTTKLEDADDAELTLLLQTMVLLTEVPPEFITKLSPQHTEVCTRGRQLRTQLPAYLEQQRASIVAHCPLPEVLQPLVAEYAAPTPKDMWTDGLRVSVVD